MFKKMIVFGSGLVLSGVALADVSTASTSLSTAVTGYIGDGVTMITAIVLAGIGLTGILWIARKAKAGIKSN